MRENQSIRKSLGYQLTYMNLNIKATQQNTYDAIVVGSGISGGWAAKELSEKGLKVLVLERGRGVEHIKDYPTALLNPWDFEHGLSNTKQDLIENPVQSTTYDEGNKHFFVSDREHPYLQDKPFRWIRGYQVGGRSLTWGRQCYRWSDLDFEANSKEGVAVDWPIRYQDIAPWYDYVEQYIGLSGRAENIPHLPDSKFLPPIPFNCVEQHFAEQVAAKFTDRLVTPARIANLTEAVNGRGPCQYRNLCSRGCPFGAYFSSNASTLPAAMATGNTTIRPFSTVKEILYDKETARATGIRISDTNTLEEIEFYSRIIFVNASTIATAALLLNSTSEVFPNGMGNGSLQVGHNLMDHQLTSGAEGDYEGFKDHYYFGRTPGSMYIPRFQNTGRANTKREFSRGYAYQGKAFRQSWRDRSLAVEGFGENFKEEISKPGPWKIWLGAWGEVLPYYDNKIYLSATQKDTWGLPLVHVDFEYRENETRMRNDMKEDAIAMLKQAGFSNISGFTYDSPGGSAVHEMGTARMGNDPKTSVLNGFNQLHEVKNVFITDGSCMTSSGTQNPSLTYMALTARACNFAVEEIKKGVL